METKTYKNIQKKKFALVNEFILIARTIELFSLIGTNAHREIQLCLSKFSAEIVAHEQNWEKKSSNFSVKE